MSGFFREEDRGFRSTPVVSGLLAVTGLLAVARTLAPGLEGVLGGLAPRTGFWQPFTASLMHGWPGVPALPHWGLNAVLMVAAGRPAERLLGSGRMALLALSAAAANAVAVALTEGVNGSSLILWSFGPPLAVALAEARRLDPGAAGGSLHGRILGVLVVMYVVITAAMTVLAYASGWRGDPGTAFVRGNLFHLTAAAVGVVYAAVWRGFIRRRLVYSGPVGGEGAAP